MPLSESEELKIGAPFKAAFTQVSERIDQTTVNNNERLFYKSLLAGGNTMANAVVTVCEGAKKVWCDGDEEKALALTKLFTLLMLSQAFRWLDNQESKPEETRTAHQSAVSNILNLFGDNSKEAVEDFFNMDIQFRYDLKHQSHMVHFGALLLGKACEACGHKCIEWSKVSFPVKSMEPLTRSRAIIDSVPIGNPNDITALWNSHAAGVQAMVKYYDEQA